MAPNKRKILESARKNAQKGAKDRALKEYEKLLKLDPRDAKLRLEIGDAYRRWGQVDEAVAAYSKVAQQYMDEGFDARAVAVFKQIQNLDPERFDSYEPLADLYNRMGLNSEAIQVLQTAADGHRKAGNKRQALDVLRKMATFDPSNTTSRIKIADLLRQEGLNDEAIAEYEEVIVELEGQGEDETIATVLERILEIDSDRVVSLVQLARNLLGRGEGASAEPFAKRAFDIDSEQVAHYELLASVYRSQQREDELIEIYRGLADLYRRRGDEANARDIIQRFVPPEAFSTQSGDTPMPSESTLLEQPAGISADETELLHEEFLDDEFLDDDLLPDPELDQERGVAEETLLNLDLDAAPEIELGADSALDLEHEAEVPVPSAPELLGDVDQLLAEASVYLRYGKREQAIEHLEAVIAREAQNRAALEKLGEAHADGGEREQAVEYWLRAAERAREEGDADGLAVLRDRVAAFDPDAAAQIASAPTESSEDLIDWSESEEQPDGMELDAAPAPDAEREDEVRGDEFEDAEDIEIDVEGLELTLDDDEGASDLDGASRGDAGPALDHDADESESVSGPGASSSMSVQIVEDLEEADFYIQQGLADEAEAIYKRVLEVAPNHPLALVRLGEMAAARGEDPGSSGAGLSAPELGADAASDDSEGPGEDLIDWSDELSDADGLSLDEDVAELEDDQPGGDEEAEDTAVDVDVSTGSPDELELPEIDDEKFELPEDDGGELDLPDADESAAGEEPLAESAEASPGAELEVLGESGSVGDGSAAEASFDLAAELNDIFDDDAEGSSAGNRSGTDDGFHAVFAEFKQGVSEALSEGDYEAHYDLGIAYREMGLLNDAIGEFEAAMHGPAHRIECLHLLGRCATEQKRHSDAVEHYSVVLADDAVTDAQTLASRFELGSALEALGDVGGAREAFEAVAALDPLFCDVETRLEQLEEAPKPDAEAEGLASDAAAEAFESFEDVIEEAAGVGGDDAAAEVEAHESLDDVIAEANADTDDFLGAVVEESEPEPTSAPKRRKKKISFV